MMRHMARIHVNAELLMRAMAMPEGTQIYNIVRHEFRPDEFIFYVEHPDLPELLEGEEPSDITPVIRADHSKRPDTWLTWDWNVKPEVK